MLLLLPLSSYLPPTSSPISHHQTPGTANPPSPGWLSLPSTRLPQPTFVLSPDDNISVSTIFKSFVIPHFSHYSPVHPPPAFCNSSSQHNPLEPGCLLPDVISPTPLLQLPLVLSLLLPCLPLLALSALKRSWTQDQELDSRYIASSIAQDHSSKIQGPESSIIPDHPGPSDP